MMKSAVISLLLASALFARGESAEWITADGAPGAATWFARTFVSRGEITSARLTTTALGVYDVYVNGALVGDDFLKPGYTHPSKTKYSFSYDVTRFLKTERGAENLLSAYVSRGWWSDGIVRAGKKSAFRGELTIAYADGSSETIATKAGAWRAGVGGPVLRSGIWEGETYDARLDFDCARLTPAVASGEFVGEVRPSAGGEVCLRHDLAMRRGPFALKKGERLVVDFGQNCAAVPAFVFRAKAGTTLTCLPGEMLNDADKGTRGCDGPKGSVYRANLRIPATNMRLEYVFAGKGTERYLPRHTFFGFRYLELSATDDVEIESVTSVPVSSVRREQEIGRLETGDPDVNRLIANALWSQRSNYLSVPTDCPQRNERLAWTGDAQVFVETGTFAADVRDFFRKWMRDMRDTALPSGAFSCIAPPPVWRDQMKWRSGWSDAGVIVPAVVWTQFGDRRIVEENWAAMERFMAQLAETKGRTKAQKESGNYQFGDWLAIESLDKFGCYQWEKTEKGVWRPSRYGYLMWDYLGGAYWLFDTMLMRRMAAALGKDEAKYAAMEQAARAYLKETFCSAADGLLEPNLRKLQTPNLFALKLGIVEGAAKERTKELLRANIKAHGGTLQTGFLGTAIALDALTENGMADVAWDLFLSHRFPSWLYEVDQGATTIWERWNSYTKKDGFGPVEMNSFNHYAYGAVVAWVWKTVAGIAADPAHPGFRNVVMRPVPDRRLKFVTADYRSAAGRITSAWRYEGENWIWEFTIPAGATATVRVPGEPADRAYAAGTHRVSVPLKETTRSF